jgi:hypothetical protein
MPTNIVIKNTNQRNFLKISPENSKVDPKTKKKTWESTGIDGFLKPGEFVDVWVGASRRVCIEEMPS